MHIIIIVTNQNGENLVTGSMQTRSSIQVTVTLNLGQGQKICKINQNSRLELYMKFQIPKPYSLNQEF